MPKEIITRPVVLRHNIPVLHECDADQFPCEHPEGFMTHTMPTLTVRWRRGGETMPDGIDSAHVGVTLTEYESIPWPQYWGDPHCDQNTPRAAPPVKQEHYSRTLTRTEINHLIAVLRRARDAAYGRDE